MNAILIVDDQKECRLATKWFLANFGYSVETARSAEEALRQFDPQIHDAVITDNSMPGLSGSEMAHVIKLRSPRTPVLMYSGNIPNDRSCLDFVLQRPAHLLLLKEALDQLVGRGRPVASAICSTAQDLH